MSDDFRNMVEAVEAALNKLLQGKIEKTVLKTEGARAYAEPVPRQTTPPDMPRPARTQ